MKDPIETIEEQGLRRREFITKSAKIAAAAPAVSLLLSQSTLVNAAISGQRPSETLQPTFSPEP